MLIMNNKIEAGIPAHKALLLVFELALEYETPPEAPGFKHSFDVALKEYYPEIHRYLETEREDLDPFYGESMSAFVRWFLDGAEMSR